jgi:charged multivesicular body protein 7
VKTYESSSATLRALLAHPSLQRDAVERTFDALADANADARELDEAVRSGMDVALGVDVSPDDEDEIKAELAALEAEAKADTRIKEEDSQQPVAIMAAARCESVPESDAAQPSPEQIDTRDLADAPSERRPASEQVLAE